MRINSTKPTAIGGQSPRTKLDFLGWYLVVQAHTWAEAVVRNAMYYIAGKEIEALASQRSQKGGNS